jgi:hypothetical protein
MGFQPGDGKAHLVLLEIPPVMRAADARAVRLASPGNRVFRQGLGKAGQFEGKNVTIEDRLALNLRTA